MKKTGFVLGLLLLLVISLSASEQWVGFTSSSVQLPEVMVIESDHSKLVLDISVPGMKVTEVEENGEIYHKLELNYNQNTHDVGKPELPMINEIIGIPDNQKVKVRILEETSVTLSGYNVYPLQTPLKDKEISEEFEIDRDFYNSENSYPEANVFLANPGIWRDVKIAGLHFVPFRYHPVSRELEVITSTRIEVEFYGRDDENILYKDNLLSPDFYNMYDSALLNFGSLGYTIDNTREVNIKYLIVTNTNALASIQPFVDWKNQQGFPVEVRILETGFETPQNIKDYIDQLYNSDDLEYVLLVGDAYPNGTTGPDNVPMNYWTDTYSDTWYVCLDGNNDFYADLAIGRITYDTIAELDGQIQKLIHHYQTPDTSTNWGENTILVAHSEQYPQKYTLCKEQIRTFNYALQTPIFEQCYGGAGATNQDIIDWVNGTSGGIFNYRGHGSETEFWQWGASGSFTNTHIMQLTNTNRYFVLFDVCCSNMEIVSYNGNCLAESFMKSPVAAVAINAAIEPSYTIPNHDYDKEMYKAIFDEGINNIGYITNYANVFVVNYHGAIGASNVRTYLWLGDSSIEPWTLQIEDLSVTHDGQLFLGVSTFDVSVMGNGSPIENARVCVSNDDGSIYAYGFTDTGGNVQVLFDTPVQDPGTAHVTVTSHNFLPYQQDIPVIPLAGPFVIFESYVIDDTATGNGNGSLENGEIVDLDMSLENIGNAQGTNVIVTITTSDPYITIVDGNENFGNIAAGAIVTVAGAFTIEAAGDIPDSHMVYFELEAVAEDTWISYFSIEAYAPMFPPQNLTGEIQNYNDIVLTWDQPDGADNTRDLTGYKVYKGGLEIAEITDPAILTFTDAVLPAGVYEYYITALFHVGESDPSNIESVILVLPVPQNPEAVTQGLDILVTWDEPATRDFSHYKVYRNLSMIADDIMVTSYLDPDVPNGTYSYNVRAVYSGGYQSALSTDAVIEHVQVNSNEVLIPANTELIGIYPNPFNPETTISYNLNEDSRVSLFIYNIKGQKVRSLVNGQIQAGYHTVTWNGKNENGENVSSGIYFSIFDAVNKEKDYTSVKKVILLK